MSSKKGDVILVPFNISLSLDARRTESRKEYGCHAGRSEPAAQSRLNVGLWQQQQQQQPGTSSNIKYNGYLHSRVIFYFFALE